jgi:hypothetical protein
MAAGSPELLAELPDTFRYAQALERISDRQLRRLIADGRITALARGLYRKSDWHGDEDLLEIASKSPKATIALRSALARHDLIDDIPNAMDIAIPRGSWTPETTSPVRWHHFDPATFEIGRSTLVVSAERSIGLYSPERGILDAFRMRHREGTDMANDVLKRWLRQGGQPSALLQMAQDFPRRIPVNVATGTSCTLVQWRVCRRRMSCACGDGAKPRCPSRCVTRYASRSTSRSVI